jgi:hypothetical protein
VGSTGTDGNFYTSLNRSINQGTDCKHFENAIHYEARTAGEIANIYSKASLSLAFFCLGAVC